MSELNKFLDDSFRDSFDSYFRDMNRDNYKATFGDTRIVIGQNLNDNTQSIKLDDSFTTRALFVANTGSGKTLCFRRALDYVCSVMKASGKPHRFCCAILPDTKDEFRSSRSPVQSKFQHLMRRGETPKGIPIRTFRPTFFNFVDDGEVPEGSEPCSLAMSDLTEIEFRVLFKYTKSTPAQQRDMDTLYNFIKTGHITTIEDLIVQSESIETNRSLTPRFINMRDKDVFDDRYPINPVMIIQQGYIPSLNYNHFEEVDDNILQAYFLIWFRKLRIARQRKQIPPLFLFIDETRLWCPRDEKSISKEEIEKGTRLDRKYGISYFLAIQDINDISDEIIRQMSDVFVSRTADMDLFRRVLSTKGFIRTGNRDETQYLKLYNMLKKVPYGWLHFDNTSKYIKEVKDYKDLVMKFYAPMSNHMES